MTAQLKFPSNSFQNVHITGKIKMFVDKHKHTLNIELSAVWVNFCLKVYLLVEAKLKS